MIEIFDAVISLSGLAGRGLTFSLPSISKGGRLQLMQPLPGSGLHPRLTAGLVFPGSKQIRKNCGLDVDNPHYFCYYN